MLPLIATLSNELKCKGWLLLALLSRLMRDLYTLSMRDHKQGCLGFEFYVCCLTSWIMVPGMPIVQPRFGYKLDLLLLSLRNLEIFAYLLLL